MPTLWASTSLNALPTTCPLERSHLSLGGTPQCSWAIREWLNPPWSIDLPPGTDGDVGHVNEVTGRGRHTSSSSVALSLPTGRRIIDTPGVRSFGLGHISFASIVSGFADLESFTLMCPKACTHESGASECQLEKALAAGALDDMLSARAHSLQRLMATVHQRLL